MNFSARDLIVLGVFTAVYATIYLVFNMLGYLSPILQLTGATVAALVNGITYMLFLTRVRRPGLITAMALLLGIMVTLAGHHPVSLLTAVVAGGAADLIAWSGRYTRPGPTVWSYAVFCTWVAGAYLPLLFLRESVLAEYSRQMGEAYARAFDALLSTPVIIGLVLTQILVGVLGGLLGRRALAEHFTRAGLA